MTEIANSPPVRKFFRANLKAWPHGLRNASVPGNGSGQRGNRMWETSGYIGDYQMSLSNQQIVCKTILSVMFIGLPAIQFGCGGNPADMVGIGNASGGGERPIVTPGDPDGDGLSTEMEADGWQVFIDNAVGQPTIRAVTSDARAFDTDGDGLTDGQERQFLTDPRSADTDSDGLSDFDEVNRWGSSPTSVDSDGDSRGPDGTLAPNPSFFDGRELDAFGTSPTLDDTDGDGLTDFQEVNQLGADPLIAEIPSAIVELVGDVTVRLKTDETTGEQRTREATTTLGQENTSAVSATDSTTTRASIESTLSATTEAEVGFPSGSKVKGSVTASVTAGFALERTATFTESSSRSTQQELQNLEGETSSFEQSVSEGFITMGAQITNNSDVAYTLRNLTFTALHRDPRDRSQFRTIATLLPSLPEGGVTLGAINGQTGVLQLTTDAEGAPQADASVIRDLMADPSGLQLELATFDLEDENGTNLAFLSNVTHQRTALITIDFGDGRVDRYRVATLVDRNPDGSAAGVTMSKIMNDIINIPYQTASREITCDMTRSAADGGCPTDASGNAIYRSGVQILTAVDGVAANESRNAFWAVISAEDAHVVPDLEFDDITLTGGQSISLAFVRDVDGDGLFAREEAIYGTYDDPDDAPGGLDQALDYDGDGLSDFEEIRVGWTAESENGVMLQFYSDPTVSDTDGDGMDDFAEREAMTDPTRRLAGSGPSVPEGAYVVDAENGDDRSTGGRDFPFETIERAIQQRFENGGGNVFIATGTYDETITLASGVNLYGGYNPDSWSRSLTDATVIEGGTTAIVGNEVTDVTIDGLVIVSADATDPSGSSIGVSLHASTNIFLNGNDIFPGSGADGNDGSNGSNGRRGDNGSRGQDSGEGVGGAGGYDNLTDVFEARRGGNGGNGAFGVFTDGFSGGAGHPRPGGSTTTQGGSGGAPGRNGNGGFNGVGGSRGSHGAGGLGFGSVADGVYTAAIGRFAVGGTSGAGGGGGGGGGVNTPIIPLRAGGGGGGGQGGRPGLPGQSGGGGGASIGILLTGGTEAEITNNYIETANGGNGGDGGLGGSGGRGGAGGNGGGSGAFQGAGGKGGNGGRGGDGGDGGSGGGGPTIGIVEDATSDWVGLGNEFMIGEPGVGGMNPSASSSTYGESGEAAEQKSIEP